MPYKTLSVSPGVFLTYRDVKVYHVYKNDDIDQGARVYWYGLSPYCSEDSFSRNTEEGCFDVRDIAKALNIPSPKTDEEIKSVLRAAIDHALDGKPQLCGTGFTYCWLSRLEEEEDPPEFYAISEIMLPEIKSALITISEFCRAADKLGLKGVILDELDLSDTGFQECIDILERLLKYVEDV